MQPTATQVAPTPPKQMTVFERVSMLEKRCENVEHHSTELENTVRAYNNRLCQIENELNLDSPQPQLQGTQDNAR
jgi:hypothetical protein